MTTYVITCNDDTGELVIDMVEFNGTKGRTILKPGDAGYPGFVKRFDGVDFVAKKGGQGGGQCWRDALGIMHCP
jgi:hypothetical protein